MNNLKNVKNKFIVKGKRLSEEERYSLYEEAVQNPEGDIEFLLEKYKRIYGTNPTSLREDFAGTGFLTCEWVKGDAKRLGRGIDLDPAPLEYGRKKHFASLSDTEKKRVQLIQGNVLDMQPFKSDIIVAFNFSYYIFKSRKLLCDYFTKVRQGLSSKGVFFIDLFGGTEAFQELIEETKKKGFTYIWDCDYFNVVDYQCRYFIHFEINGKRYERAFSYDWRMWTLPELCDILIDAGFSKTYVFWEGDDGKGGGDGKFAVSKEAENCMSWIAYVAAVP